MSDSARRPRVGLGAMLLSVGHNYRSAGINRYIVELLRALAQLNDHHLVAFTSDPKASEVVPPSVELQAVPGWTRRPLLRVFFEELRLPDLIDASDLGAYHGPAFALPSRCRIPSVVTVHDLSFFRMPNTFPRLKGLYLRRTTARSVRHADAVIAVSQFTAKELESVLGVGPERLHVVHNGVDPEFRPLGRAEVRTSLDRLGLEPGYILAVSTLQPRKNIETLYRAFGELRRRMPDAPPLVVAGGGGWNYPLQAPPGVRLLGYVDGRDLPALYNGAAVLAHPSWYEGFGLQVAEAMASGVPTVIAEASSLPEVAGEAGLAVDPADVGAWADAIQSVLTDADLASRLRLAGLARAGKFTWGRTARETTAVYRAIIARAAERAGFSVGVPGDMRSRADASGLERSSHPAPAAPSASEINTT